MRRLAVLFTMAAVGCGGSHAAENERAKERIFAQITDEAQKTVGSIDLQTLGTSHETQDLVLQMSEIETARRLRSFRLRGRLQMRFEGPGQHESIGEERVVEQAANGDLHLRIAEEGPNAGGMELLSIGRRVFGRSRYGPYVLRDRQEGLAEAREEVFGVLRTLVQTTDGAIQLQPLGAGNGCARYAIAAGTPSARNEPLRFSGRLDADTAKRFQFVYGRKLEALQGEICVDSQGVLREAKLSVSWSAGGDAGAGSVRVDWSEILTDVGQPIRIAPPDLVDPEPHRPRGPFATLSRFGFGGRSDGGEAP